MNFKGTIKKHIAPIALAASISGSVLVTTPVVAHAETANESITIVNEEKTKASSYFLTQEEAMEWLRSRAQILQEAYNITETKIYLYKGKVAKTDTILIDEKYDNKEDALERLKELEEDEYYASDVELKEIDNDLVVTYNLVGRMFRTVRSDRYQAEIKYILKTKDEIMSEHQDSLEKSEELQENPITGDDSNIRTYSATLLGSTIGLLYMSTKVKKKIR